MPVVWMKLLLRANDLMNSAEDKLCKHRTLLTHHLSQSVFMYLLRVSGGQDEHGAIWRHGSGTSFTAFIIIIIFILLCWKRLGICIFINWIKQIK